MSNPAQDQHVDPPGSSSVADQDHTAARRAALDSVLAYASGAVWVLAGFYSDKSGARIFAVYSTLERAQEAEKLLADTGSPYTPRVVRMTLDRVTPADLY